MEIAVVVDTNVVFASLIRSGGVNRYVLTLFPEMFPFFYPEVVRKEIANHIEELAEKSKLTPEELSIAMEVIFEPMVPVSASKLSQYKEVAEEYVHDVADAPFVACALMLSEEYDTVVILTWNVSDYISEKLAEREIWVMTPVEFLKWVKERV
ncbi:PIN domain-containing protein [Thermococcus sp. 9N3]|uniref:PIN domain-containing protein n=1 Tax=Thermococcus sp. 9N3 TaxID=163002 RepID=UPI0014305313|nr:PIN domain-containing protein [Thermococcus sp. 9N3]NJE48193.1 PIN domain-containing protein [Thermococcus sp. 9N3]